MKFSLRLVKAASDVVSTDKYLYSVYAPNVQGGEQASSDYYRDDFLYDLDKDPFELTNVVADPVYTEIKADLRERLCELMEEAGETPCDRRLIAKISA